MSDKKKMNEQLLGAVARWARDKGYSRPASKSEWQALLGAYFKEQQPAWYEVPDPTLHMTNDGASVQIVDPMDQEDYEDDDFAQEVDRRQRALEDNHGDDLRRDVQLMNADRAALAQQAQFNHEAPSSVTGAVIGNQIAVRSDDADTTMIVNWQGQDTDAQPVTVTILPVQIVPVANAIAVAAIPFAQVQFGVRGYAQTIRVDVCRGVQFVVGASSVTVKVGLEPQSGFAIGMQMYAGLSFKSSFKNTKVTRTFNDLIVLTQTYDIPLFAREVSLLRTTPANTAKLQFLDSTGALITETDYAANTYGLALPVPIPNNATQVIVLGTDTFQTIFGLCL